MAYLEVLEAGLMTSLQDLGRFGHQAQGVPVSGALDPVHLRLANALVGNDAGQGALEMRMLGPKFRLEAESARLALCGTGGHIELLGPEIGIIAANRSVTVRRGQFFRVNAISDSGSSVLAVEGGFDVPALYGSQSTYMLGGFGGFEGRRLAAGDHVPLSLMRIDARPEQILLDPPVFAKDAPVRVVLGPQDNYFSAEGVETFLSQPYTI
jgi:allophanate hydrolase subunit 2